MRRTRVWMLLLWVICLPGLAGISSFTVTVDNRRPHVGDPVHIEGRCMVQKGEKVVFEPRIPESDDLVVGKPETTVEHLPDGLELVRMVVQVQPFKLGEISLGSVRVQVNDQSESREIPGLEVVSLLEGKKGKEAPNPLKPQMDIRPDFRHLARLAAWVLGVLLLLCLLLLLGWRLVRHFRGRGTDGKPEKPLQPPYEEFQEAMTALLGSSYLKDGQVKPFYVALVEIGKRYLGRVLKLDTEVETSAEMLARVRDRLKESEYRMLSSFLEQCDLVKFAKMVPDQGETNHHVNLLYQLAEQVHQRLEVAAVSAPQEDGHVPV